MISKKAFRKRVRLVTSVGLAALLYFYCSPPALAQSLGAASSFAVEGGQSVTVNGTGTTINGDVGVSPGTSITGIPAGGTVTPPFTTHSNDGPAILAQAATLQLYNDLVALTPTGGLIGPQLDTLNLGPGVYSIGAADLAATGTFTLSGAGTYVFQVSSTLVANVSSNMVLNGVDPCQVFWQVTSAATLNGATFVGNVVAQAGVQLGVGANLAGRALTTSLGAVTMAGNNTVGGCSGPLSLLLVKQALTASYQNVGDAISYSYVVTNSGTSALPGPVTVLDDHAAVTCPAVVTLLSGDAITCTATYLATAADVAAGFITNIATAYAGSTASNPGQATVPMIPQPPAPAAITILKKTNGTDNPAAPGPSIAVGSLVSWTYLVTNTGGVTLTNVTVVDNQPGVVVTCPSTVLLAGANMTCTASGLATLGQYTNLGTATGTPPTGLDVIAIDVDHYIGTQVCETVPPTVSLWKIITGPPKKVVLKAQDGGGITSITVVVSQNIASVTYSMFPSGSPTFTVFPPGGITGTIYIFATKANQSLGSVIGVAVTDLCGNVTIYDPVDVTVPAGRRQAVTLTGVPGEETLVQIVNDGLDSMRITVNGRRMPVIQLRRNDTRTVSIARAMVPGDDNTIILEARGPKGSSAFVTVYPPPAAAASQTRGDRRDHQHRKRITFIHLPD